MDAKLSGHKLSNELKQLSNHTLPNNWHWVSSSPNAKVAHNPIEKIYYKEFLARDRWEKAKAIFRGSRCQRAIKMADLLAEKLFYTPAVLNSGKIDNTREYMISEAVNGIGVASYLASFLRNTNTVHIINWKRKIIHRLGSEIGRLHQEKIIHGDLRPNNILMELESSKPNFYLIDNERTKQHQRNPRKKLIKKNLIQIGMLFPIDISKTDRLRFWKSYCKNYPTYLHDRKFMASVYNKTMNRLINTPHYQPREPDFPISYLEEGKIIPFKN